MAKFQVSIKALLAATLVVAIVLAFFLNPPYGDVLVKVDRNNKITINRRMIRVGDLETWLISHRRWHRIWWNSPDMMVEAHRSATTQAINEVVDAAHAAGFNDVSIREIY